MPLMVLGDNYYAYSVIICHMFGLAIVLVGCLWWFCVVVEVLYSISRSPRGPVDWVSEGNNTFSPRRIVFRE